MTKNNFYTTGNYDNQHIHYGGYVTLGDFCTEYPQPSGEHAKRIFDDLRFDENCRKNAENRDKQKNYKKGNK